MQTRQSSSYIRSFLSAFVLLGLNVHAHAQSSDDHIAALVSGCGQGNCQNVLKGTLSQLQREELSVEQYSEQIGYYAMALYQAARTADDPSVHNRVSVALRELAAAALLPDQQDAYVRVADAIDAGETELFELEDPFSVSPS